MITIYRRIEARSNFNDKKERKKERKKRIIIIQSRKEKRKKSGSFYRLIFRTEAEHNYSVLR